MTPEENQHVNAMMRFYEAQIVNMAREGANLALVTERFAMQVKALEAELASLKPAEKPELKAVE